jgi:Domain of unknown function (DUF4190)
VSEVSQGPGWWLASDGRWYPPDQAPGLAPAGSPAEVLGGAGHADPASAFGTGSIPPRSAGGVDVPGSEPPIDAGFGPLPGATGPPGYLPPVDGGYGPPPGYPPTGPPGYAPPMDPGYGYPPGVPLYGYAPVQKTNGLAVASLVCSLVWLGGLGSILAVVFGFIARSQIRKSDGNVQGNGLAVAGIIIGFVGVAATVFFVILVVALVHHCDQTGNCTPNTYNYNFGN